MAKTNKTMNLAFALMVGSAGAAYAGIPAVMVFRTYSKTRHVQVSSRMLLAKQSLVLLFSSREQAMEL